MTRQRNVGPSFNCRLVLDTRELVAAAGLDPSFYAESTYDDSGKHGYGYECGND